MKFKFQTILLILSILFPVFVLHAQKKIDAPSAIVIDENIPCESFGLIRVVFSVWSNKKGYLKDLTENDFDVYDQGKIQEINSSVFDGSKNQYILDFHDNCLVAPHDVKIKVKLPQQSKRNYGKISVRLQR